MLPASSYPTVHPGVLGDRAGKKETSTNYQGLTESCCKLRSRRVTADTTRLLGRADGGRSHGQPRHESSSQGFWTNILYITLHVIPCIRLYMILYAIVFQHQPGDPSVLVPEDGSWLLLQGPAIDVSHVFPIEAPNRWYNIM